MSVSLTQGEAEIIALLRECAGILDGRKGEETKILDLREVNSYLDFFIITTGSSHLHCRAMAREIQDFLAARNRKARNRPDMDSGWIILDYGDMVIHIFTFKMRDFYQLEKLWGDAGEIDFQCSEQ